MQESELGSGGSGGGEKGCICPRLGSSLAIQAFLAREQAGGAGKVGHRLGQSSVAAKHQVMQVSKLLFLVFSPFYMSGFLTTTLKVL
jgi:hypothetical protein